MSYIRFGFEGNGTEWGGSLPLYHKPQYTLPHVRSHTIIHLPQKNHYYTNCFTYLRLVIQTLPLYLSNKKTACIAQNYAIFSMNYNYTWHYVQQKNNALNKKTCACYTKNTRSPYSILTPFSSNSYNHMNLSPFVILFSTVTQSCCLIANSNCCFCHLLS